MTRWIRAARLLTLPWPFLAFFMGCGLALSTFAFTLLFCVGLLIARPQSGI